MQTLTINSAHSDVRRAATFLYQFCEQHSIGNKTQGQLDLILVEALNNVVEHAYPDNVDGSIVIELDYIDNEIVIKITDQGIAAPESFMIQEPELPNHNHLPEGGWGLCLIQALTDTIEYFRFSDHNTLVLTKVTA